MITPSLKRGAVRLLLVIAAALVGCGATPAKSDSLEPSKEVQAERDQIIGAMTAELDRSMNQMKLGDYDPAYFIAYKLRDVEERQIRGKYGAITYSGDQRSRVAYVEVRVGDYDFDNYANIETENFRLQEYVADRSAPLDTGEIGIRGTLWLLTDETYKKAVSDFLTKKGGAIYATDDKVDVPSLSKEPAAQYRGPVLPLKFDRSKWEEPVKKVTKALLDIPELIDSEMDVTARRVVRYFVNSEGTTIVEEFTVHAIHVTAWARSEDGMLLENGRSYYARSLGELPGTETLVADAKVMAADLVELKNAPAIEPYTGPAILMQEASGVLFHEAVGHRLEGERQRDDEEGRTFKGRVGQEVVPPFLSVFDDPTLTVEGKTQLNGHYAYDDEGVAAERAVLVDKGILKGFLKSRTPIEGSLKSNGHGRAAGTSKPMARMANLVVEADPEKAVPYEQLKKMLIAEVKKQGKPFGLIIRDITGGSTNTSGYGYQAFKGSPRLIYKVDPETGEETLVRGAELVGTPLASINKIVAASKEIGVFNGYCGAESGYVPVSTVSPALLTTEIELQRVQTVKEREPILAPPWRAKAK